MKKLFILISACATSSVVIAQTLNQVFPSVFERTVTPNATRNAQLVAIWDAIDQQKTNTALRELVITRNGTNISIKVIEMVQVKIIEN